MLQLGLIVVVVFWRFQVVRRLGKEKNIGLFCLKQKQNLISHIWLNVLKTKYSKYQSPVYGIFQKSVTNMYDFLFRLHENLLKNIEREPEGELNS